MNAKHAYLGVVFLVVALVGGSYSFGHETTDQDDTIIDPSLLQELSLAPEGDISHVHSLAVDVADPNKLWIATHYGLFVLINEEDLYRIGDSQDDYMGFAPHPSESQTFFSSGHPLRGGNLGFQISYDGGITWKKISDGVGGPIDFHTIAVSPVNPQIIYGWYNGNVQRSDDRGETWSIVHRGISIASLAADTENENVVYAATFDGKGVLVSKNRGVSWRPLSPQLLRGEVAAFSVHPQNSKIQLVYSEKLGGLGISKNGGRTWLRVKERFNNEAVLHVAFDTTDPHVVYAATQHTKIYTSRDTGISWKRIF